MNEENEMFEVTDEMTLPPGKYTKKEGTRM